MPRDDHPPRRRTAARNEKGETMNQNHHVLRCARLAARLARAAAESLEAPGAARAPRAAAAQIAALLAALVAAPVPGSVDDVVDDDALEPLSAGIGLALTASRAAVRAGARAAPEAPLRRCCAVIAGAAAAALEAAARLGDALTALMDGDAATAVWVAEAFDAEADLDGALRRLADASSALRAVAGADEDSAWAASAASSCSETLREWATAVRAAAVDERVGGATAPRN
jgi:hypothetical protein